MDYSELLKMEPYSLKSEEKRRLLAEELRNLTEYHFHKCTPYRNILHSSGHIFAEMHSIEQIPFIPVRLMKELELKSIPDEEVFKTMTSSGTTGQQVSKIYLDRETAANQQKTLVKIVSSYLGTERMPMLIIDCPSVLRNRQTFSARGAGILGFSIFGTDKTYALDDDMNLNVDAVLDFLEKHENKTILMFGFTFMIWQHFYKELAKLKEKGIYFDLHKGVLIHGGGWKKLAQEAVTMEEYNTALREVCGIQRVYDYYGMAEQTGCVYMQCECGHLHASIFSDVITRRSIDFSICEYGEEGMMQVLSLLPKSYPGHSLLTEDKGIILGEDDCACKRKGKYFKITGRIKSAELRGCSDTYAAGHN